MMAILKFLLGIIVRAIAGEVIARIDKPREEVVDVAEPLLESLDPLPGDPLERYGGLLED